MIKNMIMIKKYCNNTLTHDLILTLDHTLTHDLTLTLDLTQIFLLTKS